MHSEYCSDGGSVEIVYPYTLRIVRGGTRKRVDVRTTYSYSKMPERIRRAFTIPTTMFVVYNRNRRVGDVDNVGIAHTLRVRCAVERRIEGLEHMHCTYCLLAYIHVFYPRYSLYSCRSYTWASHTTTIDNRNKRNAIRAAVRSVLNSPQSPPLLRAAQYMRTRRGALEDWRKAREGSVASAWCARFSACKIMPSWINLDKLNSLRPFDVGNAKSVRCLRDYYAPRK